MMIAKGWQQIVNFQSKYESAAGTWRATWCLREARFMPCIFRISLLGYKKWLSGKIQWSCFFNSSLPFSHPCPSALGGLQPSASWTETSCRSEIWNIFDWGEIYIGRHGRLRFNLGIVGPVGSLHSWHSVVVRLLPATKRSLILSMRLMLMSSKFELKQLHELWGRYTIKRTQGSVRVTKIRPSLSATKALHGWPERHTRFRDYCGSIAIGELMLRTWI